MKASGFKAGSALALLALFAHAEYAPGQKAAELAERLHRSETASSLDAADVKPWHLKLAVSLFDDKGKAEEDGFIEEWWVDPHKWRVVYSTPSFSSTQVENDRGYFHTKGAGVPPLLLSLLHDQVVHPLPAGEDVNDAKPDLRKQSFGKVPLECIMLDQEIKQVAYPPLGLFPTFCFDPGKDSLRITYNFGSETVLRNSIGRFQDRTVALDTIVMLSGEKAATAHVTALSGLATSTAEMLSANGLDPGTKLPAMVDVSVMKGTILSKETPLYPESAKSRHITGAVVIRAVIGPDGHVHSLRLVSVPDPDLAIAAIAAVRHWTYKPYLLNGEPTSVDTTITVNFQMSR